MPITSLESDPKTLTLAAIAEHRATGPRLLDQYLTNRRRSRILKP